VSTKTSPAVVKELTVADNAGTVTVSIQSSYVVRTPYQHRQKSEIMKLKHLKEKYNTG